MLRAGREIVRAVPFGVWLGLTSLLLLVSAPLCVFVVVVLSVLRLLSRFVTEGDRVPSAPPPRRRRWETVHSRLVLDEAGRIGLRGEKEVLRRLERLADDTVILHDVQVPAGAGTTQLDSVVVSPDGITVLEVKAWTGRIYGQENDRHWTQVKLYGRDVWRERRENPVDQNGYHCHALRQYLAQHGVEVPLRSMVVFTEAELTTRTTTPVVTLEELPMVLAKGMSPGGLTPAEVTQIGALLRPLVLDPSLRPAVSAASSPVAGADLPPPASRQPSKWRGQRSNRPVGVPFLARLAAGLLKVLAVVTALLFINHMLGMASSTVSEVGRALGGSSSEIPGVPVPVGVLKVFTVLLVTRALLQALAPGRRRRW